MEITARFPTDTAARERIAQNNEAAAAAFAQLREGLPSNLVVVADWVKRQFSNHRTYPVRTAADLQFVVRGTQEAGCTNLRFFAVPASQAPSDEVAYGQTLFA